MTHVETGRFDFRVAFAACEFSGTLCISTFCILFGAIESALLGSVLPARSTVALPRDVRFSFGLSSVCALSPTFLSWSFYKGLVQGGVPLRSKERLQEGSQLPSPLVPLESLRGGGPGGSPNEP